MTVRRMVSLVVVLLAVGTVGASSSTAQSGARVPSNGRILFEAIGACFGSECFDPANPNYDLWTVAPDGTGVVNLTKTPGVDGDGKWSPDGTEIAFTSNRDGNWNLFLMAADGSNVRQLTNDVGSDGSPAWGPRAGWITFVHNSRRRDDIMIMRRDGTGRRRLAAFEAPAGIFGLSWSRNGRWLTFTKGPDKNEEWHIWVVRRDGTGLRRVDRDTSLAVSESSSWSPDGRRLVFSGEAAKGLCQNPARCDYDIWIIKRDGTGLRKLVGDGTWQFTPEWSPDGDEIVYIHEGDNLGGGDLWVVDVDGSNNHSVLAKPDSYDWYPDWQPLR